MKDYYPGSRAERLSRPSPNFTDLTFPNLLIARTCTPLHVNQKYFSTTASSFLCPCAFVCKNSRPLPRFRSIAFKKPAISHLSPDFVCLHFRRSRSASAPFYPLPKSPGPSVAVVGPVVTDEEHI